MKLSLTSLLLLTIIIISSCDNSMNQSPSNELVPKENVDKSTLDKSSYLKLDTNYSKFLIFKSQNLDYYPVWGESDKVIYINIMSKEWRKYDLSNTIIMDGTYYEQDLAINTAYNYEIVTNKKTISMLEANKEWRPREIIASNNTIKLSPENYNTVLSINDETVMNIKGNAHSLTLSPSKKYFACLFELSGLMIFDISKELDVIKKKKEMLAKMSNIEKAKYFEQNREMKSLEQILLNFSIDEKKTNDYKYYFGLISYSNSQYDTSLIDIAIENLTIVCNDSNFYISNVLLSSLYQNKNNWEKSFKYANRAIELIPDHPSGYSMKGDYYEHKGSLEKACEFYTKALENGDRQIQMKLLKCNQQPKIYRNDFN